MACVGRQMATCPHLELSVLVLFVRVVCVVCICAHITVLITVAWPHARAPFYHRIKPRCSCTCTTTTLRPCTMMQHNMAFSSTPQARLTTRTHDRVKIENLVVVDMRTICKQTQVVHICVTSHFLVAWIGRGLGCAKTWQILQRYLPPVPPDARL